VKKAIKIETWLTIIATTGPMCALIASLIGSYAIYGYKVACNAKATEQLGIIVVALQIAQSKDDEHWLEALRRLKNVECGINDVKAVLNTKQIMIVDIDEVGCNASVCSEVNYDGDY